MKTSLVGEIQDKLAAQHDLSFQAASGKHKLLSLQNSQSSVAQQGLPLKKLQEAILTLEWEISPRSVAGPFERIGKIAGQVSRQCHRGFRGFGNGARPGLCDEANVALPSRVHPLPSGGYGLSSQERRFGGNGSVGRVSSNSDTI